MNFAEVLSKEFSMAVGHSTNIINLIDEGNTIPFIARYRKEMTGSCDDQVLRDFADRLEYLRKFTERKDAVTLSITEQGVMTEQIQAALDGAVTLTEIEDIYRPYKPKRKTKATVAVAKGLQPLADIIFEQSAETKNIQEIAKEYVNPEKEVNSVEEAIAGAADIVAERISDDALLRKLLREQIYEKALITTKLVSAEDKKAEKVKDKLATYEMYKEHSEPVNKIPSHRILAINRGEKEECLKVEIEIDKAEPLNVINNMFVKNVPVSGIVKAAGEDAYDRLIKPSIDREVRNELFEKASEQAIKMFEVNLRPLLLQPPIKDKVTMGLDPAYRTGCKIAVVDGNGKVLDRAIVYPTPPQSKVEEAKAVLKALIIKHKVDIISIGNGTASKESEIFTAELIKEMPDRQLSYMIVNEAGASVYSASKLGAEEFPDFDVAHRSAASIARRLQDPLSELIKIDPKSIGVGQYQHDMPANRLDTVLGGVVEDCVNSVGVDINTASYSLLAYVAGLNLAIAKNLVKYREEKGAFKSRQDLLNVPKLGPKAFEQCAGFLRIPNAKNVLDNTAVHPESYVSVIKLLQLFKLSLESVARNEIKQLPELVKAYGEEEVAKACGVGVPTLQDVVAEILKPGRDIREALPAPMLRTDVMDMADLKEGMEIIGTVRNVIDFGVFVDIGVHQDGLVHISEITDRYIKHPSEVLSVGEVVKVKVLGVDTVKKRISLTMKAYSDSAASERAKEAEDKRDKKRPEARADNRNNNANRNNNGNSRDGRDNRSDFKDRRENVREPELSLEDQLKKLADKFNRH